MTKTGIGVWCNQRPKKRDEAGDLMLLFKKVGNALWVTEGMEY